MGASASIGADATVGARAPIVVAGGGLSGLFAAHLLRRRGHEVVLFEASDRFGGRALEATLDGTPVKLGAGVVRERDCRLIALAEALRVPIAWTTPSSSSSSAAASLSSSSGPTALAATQALRERFERARLLAPPSELDSVTFDEFLGPDKSIYGLWGRTDMMREDVARVFTIYGLEDIDGSSKPVGFLRWTDLVARLVEANERLGVRLHRNARLDVRDARSLCVVATTKNGVGDMLPEVEAWPFYRLYLKLAGPWPADWPRVRPTGTLLQTVIAIDPSKGLLMAAYADGPAALAWQRMPRADRLRTARDVLVRELGWDPSIEVVASIDKFWAEGIHYVVAGGARAFAERVSAVQGNLVFAGEMTALVNQGWVEGALESAERASRLVDDAVVRPSSSP